MIIKLGKLKEGIHTFEGKDNPESIGLDKKIFNEDVNTKVTIDKRSQNYYLTIKSVLKGKFCCDRCLKMFSREIVAESNIIYTYDETLVDELDDEIRFIRVDEEKIDVSEDIKQFIILSVPIKMLCDKDCKGLCPHCGKSLNEGKCGCKSTFIDPRWNKLKDLKF